MKKINRILSSVLALSTIFLTGITASVSAETIVSRIQSGTVQTISKVNAPNINVTVPTSFLFSLNPNGNNGKEQIYSDNYKFVNKSNIPVSISMTVTPTVSSGVKLVKEKTQILNNGTANAYLQLEFADTWNVNTGTPAEMDDTSLDYGINHYILPFNSPANFNFLLEKAEFNTATPPAMTALGTSEPGASFKLTGSLDESYPWTSTSIRLNVVYKISSIRESTYNKRNSFINNNAKGLITPALIDRENLKKTDLISKNDVTYIIGTGALTIKSIGTYNKDTGRVTALSASTYYKLSSNNTVIWLNAPPESTPIAFTMSDSSIYYYDNNSSGSGFSMNKPA